MSERLRQFSFLGPNPAEATNAKRTEENNVRKNICQVHQKKYLYEVHLQFPNSCV